MVKKKLNKEQQSKVDKLASARDLYGKGSREGTKDTMFPMHLPPVR